MARTMYSNAINTLGFEEYRRIIYILQYTIIRRERVICTYNTNVKTEIKEKIIFVITDAWKYNI